MSRTSKNLAAWQVLSRSHRRLQAHLETALKDADLPGLDVLDVLTALEDSREDLTAKALEEQLLMPQYGVSRLLDRMEKDAQIRRIADTHDKRLKHIHLTDTGRTTHMAMVKTRDAALEGFLSLRAKPGQLDRMADLLARLDRGSTD